jgi:hypothetical protein
MAKHLLLVVVLRQLQVRRQPCKRCRLGSRKQKLLIARWQSSSLTGQVSRVDRFNRPESRLL